MQTLRASNPQTLPTSPSDERFQWPRHRKPRMSLRSKRRENLKQMRSTANPPEECTGTHNKNTLFLFLEKLTTKWTFQCNVNNNFNWYVSKDGVPARSTYMSKHTHNTNQKINSWKIIWIKTYLKSADSHCHSAKPPQSKQCQHNHRSGPKHHWKAQANL